ncbi:MAG: DUF4980 domain-containing protein [Bacteroidetes bacterium]|nr:DUF4980 domain-containing protein [Bacteroidota bacterium]
MKRLKIEKIPLALFLASGLFMSLTFGNLYGQEVVRSIKIEKQYLNYPVEMDQDRQMMKFVLDGDTLTYSEIRLAGENIDYWVFTDVSAYKGKILSVIFDAQATGIDKIYQSDRFAGEDSLYREALRPQFHFTPRVGWNNDPNGLVWFEGEYHLFFQHNPYETKWGNMHWGHAVSKDLIHWEELDDALYPDQLGTMFSGSAVIDRNNTSGWGENVMVAIYTADRSEPRHEVQCVAYSNDRGRTFTKYEGNPVIDSREMWNSYQTRDPKVFWYEPNREWVMALFELDGVSIYTSKNLKKWQYESHTMGFWECPELFELPVDGDPDQTRWVMYGVDNSYMIGDFDGKVFSPEKGKYKVTYGLAHAAQTFNNVPDGRRIQMAWGRTQHPGMRFSQMICFPTEISLRTTQEGVRVFHNPIGEVESLHKRSWEWKNLGQDEANRRLKEITPGFLHVRASIELERDLGFHISFRGNKILNFNGYKGTLNDHPHHTVKPGVYEFDIELLIDATSMEAFIDGGRIYITDQVQPPLDESGILFNSRGKLLVKSLEVSEMNSIWK